MPAFNQDRMGNRIDREPMGDGAVCFRYEVDGEFGDGLALMTVYANRAWEEGECIYSYRVYDRSVVKEWTLDSHLSDTGLVAVFSVHEGRPSVAQALERKEKKIAEKRNFDVKLTAFRAWVAEALPRLKEMLSFMGDKVVFQQMLIDYSIVVNVYGSASALRRKGIESEVSIRQETPWAEVEAWIESIKEAFPPPLPSGKPRPKRRHPTGRG